MNSNLDHFSAGADLKQRSIMTKRDSENALNKYANFYDYKKVQEKIISVFLDLI